MIFLDEPTAGMDPFSRRHVWSVLKNRRKGKVILLTTHFMDEADILAGHKFNYTEQVTVFMVKLTNVNVPAYKFTNIYKSTYILCFISQKIL